MDVIKYLNAQKATPVIAGVVIGVFVSMIADLVYILVFHEGSPEFYPIAGIVFLGGPLAGGIISALIAEKHKWIALPGTGSAVFIIVSILAILSYVVLPLFFYESVQIPAAYTNNASNTGSRMPSYLNYTIPGVGTGTLITSDKNTAVVVLADYDRLPFASTVYVINKSSNKVIRSLNFNNDVIAAAIDQGTLNLFNDKIGYFIDTETGEFVKTIVRLDNYRGLFASNNNTYMQTTFETSVLNADGSVGSHRRMYMNCTALGYFISGSPGRVIS